MTAKAQDQKGKAAAEKDAPEGDQREDAATDTPDSATNPTTGEATQPPTRDVTIKVSDATLDVTVEGAGEEDEPSTLGDLEAKDLQTLQRAVLEEAARRGETDERPFRDMDTESLLVLYHAVREEVASR